MLGLCSFSKHNLDSIHKLLHLLEETGDQCQEGNEDNCDVSLVGVHVSITTLINCVEQHIRPTALQPHVPMSTFLGPKC